MKARAEKTAHIQEQPSEQQTHQNDDDDDDTIDWELESSTEDIAAAERERKIRKSIASKNKNL
jgi:hypothetical protein